jgi:hypothetical protein
LYINHWKLWTQLGQHPLDRKKDQHVINDNAGASRHHLCCGDVRRADNLLRMHSQQPVHSIHRILRSICHLLKQQMLLVHNKLLLTMHRS